MDRSESRLSVLEATTRSNAGCLSPFRARKNLLRGDALADALDYARTRVADLNERERDFIRHSERAQKRRRLPGRRDARGSRRRGGKRFRLDAVFEECLPSDPAHSRQSVGSHRSRLFPGRRGPNHSEMDPLPRLLGPDGRGLRPLRELRRSLSPDSSLCCPR